MLFGALYGLCGVAHQLCRVVALLDPVKTEIQGFGYDIRTASLPFFFIFNTDLVLIGVNSVWHAIAIFIVALTAMMAFAFGDSAFSADTVSAVANLGPDAFMQRRRCRRTAKGRG